MGRWRRKLLFSLIVYCAGFATAIYVLAPSSAQASETTQTTASGWSTNATTWVEKAQTSQWTGKLKTGMDKCISFAEDNALRAAEMIRSHTGQSDQSE